jgi:SAM-dependent methyltransferase
MAGEPDDVDAMVEPVVPSRHRWLAGLLAAVPGDRVVDLGCGTGASLVQAAPGVPGGLLAGVDLSAAALARSAEALGDTVAGLSPPTAVLVLQVDLKAPLPLADAAFDRVLCHNVLEVLPDQAAVVLGRRFARGEIGWGYARNLVDTLTGSGRADPAELDRWLAGLQRLDDRGAFLFSVNDYAVLCGRMRP